MSNSQPTPTTHGAWRVIDGQLVNEADLPPPAPADAEPSTPAPEAPTPNAPTHRRKASTKE
ncbi:hypothetical protein [Pseudoxanthomonas mexicana]|uniref:hypothetical protein n=1 Tax=Pseudoxanthomonas mexicana TaxID=128785 RepID=UPI00398B5C36